jgi:protein TonB
MPYRSNLLLTLIWVTPLALAQDAATRVEREANNPLRMIIEASKIKPKAKPAETARPPERAAPAVPPRPLASASAPAESTRVEVPSDKVESAVATVEVDGQSARSVALPAVPVAEPVPAAPLAPLQIADVVEPRLPPSLIGKLRGEILVVVGFTVRADGTVAEPVIRSTSHPQTDEAVLEAVRQWRYQPIAAPRAHEVQLVLRPAG